MLRKHGECMEQELKIKEQIINDLNESLMDRDDIYNLQLRNGNQDSAP